MFSADELNKVCSLGYGGDYKIVEFNQYHMEMLELNKHDKAWHKYYKNYANKLDYYRSFSFTGLAFGNVVCCLDLPFFGMEFIYWLLPTTRKVRNMSYHFIEVL